MRNAFRSAIASGLILLAGCASMPERAANTQATRTNPTRPAATQSYREDTIKLNGKDYVPSPLQKGYTAKINGSIIPRSNILLYLTPAENSVIENGNYIPSSNATFAVNVVYTNKAFVPNTSESLATSKVIVYSGKANPKTTKTGEFTSTRTTPSVIYPTKTVTVGSRTARIGEMVTGNGSITNSALFCPSQSTIQREHDGTVEVIQPSITWMAYDGEVVETPSPTNTTATNQLEDALSSIPVLGIAQ